MNNRPLKFFGIAALVAQCLMVGACSSSGGAAGGTGGNTGVGTGAGGAVVVGVMGSCTPGMTNPDFVAGGACWDDCASVSCGRPCKVDCCVTCGIDQAGSKYCTCPTPDAPYDNCSCSPPSDIPAGLQGGPCMPAGDSRVTPPAGVMSLRGLPCKMTNLVCFTSDSTATSERGCICKADGVLHCGSVNHWFVNNGVPTTYTP